MRNRHQCIVDDDCEVVGGNAVRADQYRIADDLGAERHLTADNIDELHGAVLRHTEADHCRLAVLHAPPRVGRGYVTASADIHGRAAGLERMLTIGLELLGRAETPVRLTARHQLDGVSTINVEPLGLPVRAIVPAGLHAFGPVQPHPAQIGEDAALGLARGPLEVGVLDTQDERAARRAREHPVEQRRTRVADMQQSRRTRSESQSHRSIISQRGSGARRRERQSMRQSPSNRRLRWSFPSR